VGQHTTAAAVHVKSAIKGFAAPHVAAGRGALARRPDVLSVEQNGYVYASATQRTPRRGVWTASINAPCPLDNAYTSDLNAAASRCTSSTPASFGHADFGGRDRHPHPPTPPACDGRDEQG